MVEPSPLIIEDIYPIQWRRPNIDLTELARLRWIKRWSVARLGQHFNRSPETIQMHICRFRAKGLEGLNLKAKELLKVRTSMKAKGFRGI